MLERWREYSEAQKREAIMMPLMVAFWMLTFVAAGGILCHIWKKVCEC